MRYGPKHCYHLSAKLHSNTSKTTALFICSVFKIFEHGDAANFSFSLIAVELRETVLIYIYIISASISRYSCYTSPASCSHHVAANVDGASQLIISASKKDFLLVDIGQREYSRNQKVQSSSVIIPTIRGSPFCILSVV
jgi:hypothetical protein